MYVSDDLLVKKDHPCKSSVIFPRLYDNFSNMRASFFEVLRERFEKERFSLSISLSRGHLLNLSVILFI